MASNGEFGFLERYPAHEFVLGPIQRSEAICLYGLLRCIRPRRVVEIGFGEGDSTETLLAATRDVPGCRVTSYDIRVSAPHAAALRDKYPHLQIVEADQAQVDLGPDPVDLLFLDASHDLGLNKAFWARNERLLGPTAMVVVHDTGLWADGTYNNEASLETFGTRGVHRGVSGRFHQPDEVAFVRWLTTGPGAGWTRVDVGSANTFRHGFTILQRVDG